MNDWFVVELEDGKRIRCRRFMEQHAQSKIYPYRIEFFWTKTQDPAYDLDMIGKLEEELKLRIEQVNEAWLVAVTEDNTQYILTWYARDLESFGEKMNNTLMFYPKLPVSVFSTNDSEWTAYFDMTSLIKDLN